MKNAFPSLFLTVLLLIISVNNLLAQGSFEPIFEDAEGKTSIIAPRGFFGMNTANSSLRFQYFYSKSASPDPKDRRLVGKWNRFYCGANVSGAASGGLTNLFSEGNINPGTSADLFLGHRSLFFGTVDRSDRTGESVKSYSSNKNKPLYVQDWLTLRTGVQSANYRLYDASKPFNQQIATEAFRGHIAQLAYTVLINGATSAGVSFDVSKVNNIDNLNPVKFKQETRTTDPTGQITRTFEREINAFTGNYQTLSVRTYGMDIVQLLIPNETKYAFHAYGRLQTGDGPNVIKSGLGFYIFPKGKLFGGVFIGSNDLTNKLSDTPHLLKRIDIGITVKYVLPSLGGVGE